MRWTQVEPGGGGAHCVIHRGTHCSHLRKNLKTQKNIAVSKNGVFRALLRHFIGIINVN